ncbi:MAG: putative rRNA maturation factor [Acidobacteriota bacterium]|nr:putative rRNA maturation factor [Acidobacteriota bacterium]
MTDVEVTGGAVPRFSRREMANFTRTVLLTLGNMGLLPYEINEVSIALVEDEAMANLNRQFRHKNKTTDVLTFPADDTYADPDRPGRPLGDIVISLDQAKRQSVTEKHSLATEIRYLILHGILHALGHDHETDTGEMNALEIDLRTRVGLT